MALHAVGMLHFRTSGHCVCDAVGESNGTCALVWSLAGAGQVETPVSSAQGFPTQLTKTHVQRREDACDLRGIILPID